MFRHKFDKSISNIRVGFAGGIASSPSYEQVCTGATQHAEVVHFEYDETELSYDELLDFFFRMHDPTTLNRQGGDIGTQYRSAIFFHSEEQRVAAEKFISRAQLAFGNSKISTTVEPCAHFWDAEEYHQDYLTKNPHAISGNGSLDIQPAEIIGIVIACFVLIYMLFCIHKCIMKREVSPIDLVSSMENWGNEGFLTAQQLRAQQYSQGEETPEQPLCIPVSVSNPVNEAKISEQIISNELDEIVEDSDPSKLPVEGKNLGGSGRNDPTPAPFQAMQSTDTLASEKFVSARSSLNDGSLSRGSERSSMSALVSRQSSLSNLRATHAVVVAFEDVGNVSIGVGDLVVVTNQINDKWVSIVNLRTKLNGKAELHLEELLSRMRVASGGLVLRECAVMLQGAVFDRHKPNSKQITNGWSVAGGKLVVPAATPNSAKAFTGKAITETLRPPEAPNHDSSRNASNNPSIATADSDHSDSDSQAGGRQHTRTRSFGSDLRAIYKGTSPKKVAALFPEIDSVENPITVIDVYSCALEKDILWQGRLYLTSTHIGFHGVIFGKTERLVVNLRDVISIEKKLIAGMFPNAIKLTLLERSVRSFYHSLVDADHAQYTFGSFLKRDSAYFDISTQWKLVRVRLQPFKQSALPGRSNASEDEQADTSRSNITQDFEKGWDFAPRIRATTEVAVSTPTVALLERIPSAGNVQKRVFSFPSSSLDPLGVLAPPGMDLYEACLSVKEEMIHRRAVDHVSSEGGNSSGKFTVSNERGKRKPADNQPAKDSNDPPNQSNGNPEDNDNLSKDVLNSVVKGPVRCPCERHDGVLLVNETFDFNFKGFLHTALKEGHGSKTMHDTYTSCGTDGIIFWDWETGDDGSKSRKIEYTARFGGVLGNLTLAFDGNNLFSDGQDIFCKDRQQILHLTDE
ncbi:Peptide-methionine (S)-S-oxide reductase [Entophlyctis luteolus]|nr:Peptide-methionine (S)-S-oxide reductase [Entophlyctis luteolus]